MPAPKVPRALGPLRHGRFRLLAAGQLASNVGDSCYAVALPWYVLAVHGGPILLGTVLAAYGVPRTLLIAVGGYASDRWRPQTVMMASDLARALAVAALAVTAGLGPARAAVLIPIAIVLGAGEGLFLPGSFSIIPSLVPGDDLQAANALSSGWTQLATLIGPAVGGALVALGGTSVAFGIDAATFAVSAVTLAALRAASTAAPGLSPPADPEAGLGAGTGPRAAGGADAEADPGSGKAPSLLTVVRSERVLLVMLLVTLAANLGSGGMDQVALPALAHGPLRSGASGYGLILAAFGAGALAGTLVAGQIPGFRRPAVTGSLAFLAEAACVAAVPWLGTTITVAAAMAAIGIANGFGNVLTITAFQRWAAPSLLGRLMGLILTASFGVFPVSVVVAAFFTRDLGPASFFLFAAAALAVALLAGLTQRSWRDFGASPVPAPLETAPANTARPETALPETTLPMPGRRELERRAPGSP